MEEDVYSRLPKKIKFELNLPTLVGGILTIMFAFVLPIALITSYEATPNTQNSIQTTNNLPSGGQVAGVSTQKDENIIRLPIINEFVSLEGQSGSLIIIG
ncbi:hypothetical protein IH575_04315, partial [Candidatus Dojkabacteria bacterium]|nr:hypothetical protein [Candidatus Dojkabacteria bacterium]